MIVIPGKLLKPVNRAICDHENINVFSSQGIYHKKIVATLGISCYSLFSVKMIVISEKLLKLVKDIYDHEKITCFSQEIKKKLRMVRYFKAFENSRGTLCMILTQCYLRLIVGTHTIPSAWQ